MFAFFSYISHFTTDSPSGSVSFDILNLNSGSNWFTESNPEATPCSVLCLQQLEKDTIFVGTDRVAKFVDRNGVLKSSSQQASQLTFERKSEHMGMLVITDLLYRQLR